MNWFWLHRNPTISARKTCDQHVVKMVVEASQLLFTAMAARGKDDWFVTCPGTPYKPSHVNHPLGIWVRLCESNFNALARAAVALVHEYRVRFAKEHACEKYLIWLLQNGTTLWDKDLENMALENARVYYAEDTWLATRACPRGCTPVPICCGTYKEELRQMMAEKVNRKGDNLVRAYRYLYRLKRTKGFRMRFKNIVAQSVA